MTYVTPTELADTLGVDQETVIDAIIELLDDHRFMDHAEFSTADYAISSMHLQWRAVCRVRRHICTGMEFETKCHYDQLTTDLIKSKWPDAPVMVRNACKACSTESASDLLGIRNFT